MKILWFNWRDIKNPDFGGAEVLTHEIAKRLVSKGHDITLFSAMFSGCTRSENLDGVNIIRDGRKFTVYNKARSFYKKNEKGYDIIIDEINVKPFLTPKFVKHVPIVALIHQISPEQFLLELPFPLNYLGFYYFEKKWLSYYRNIPTITVSNSTRSDLEKLGLKKLFIVPEGLNTSPLSELPEKEQTPTIVFIGRLKRHKLPDHAIAAFLLIKNTIPSAQLWVIGDGYMRNELEEKFKNVVNVTFFGRVDQELKFKLLSKAHLVLVPAIREGWGLVVTESNSMGTPVVAYNVPGLRDSVRHGQTGILVQDNSPESLAISAIRLLQDRNFLNILSANALSYSKHFSWDISANLIEKIMLEQIRYD